LSGDAPAQRTHEWVDAAVSGAIGLVAVPPVLLGTRVRHLEGEPAGEGGLASSFVDISVAGTTKPKIIGCVDTNAGLREPAPAIVDAAAMVLPDALTIPGPSTNVGYIHRREKAL
jgi:hypothetical protein